jgi:hypothetical protein
MEAAIDKRKFLTKSLLKGHNILEENKSDD